jgi:hypothetical protein
MLISRLPAAAVPLAMVAALLCGPSAHAQETQAPARPPVSVGGEVSATISAEDPGFFTYTDYDQDLLRQLRLRLLGEWQPLPSLAFVGELRTLNADRLDAAAWYVRWQPWRDHDVAIQAGRIPPVVGAFARRAYGRDNPMFTVPLAYQYLTSLRTDAVAASTDDLLGMRARGWRPSFPIGSTDVEPGIPLISSINWPTGAEAYWRSGVVEAAGALTLGSAAGPAVFSLDRGNQWSGRIGVATPSGLTAGFSLARGQWLDDDVIERAGGGAATQTLSVVDAEYGRGPWLLRGEWIRSTFQIPLRDSPATDQLPAWSAFTDVRYRISPRWQVAGRFDRLAFGTIDGTTTPVSRTWDADVTRLEAVLSYRVSRRLEVRGGWLEHWREGGLVRRRGMPAASVLFWF